MTDQKICRRCKKPVLVNAENYDVFERMHWLCFHFEYEHEGDPDKACDDPSCPWWRIDVYKNKLDQLGVDSESLIAEALERRWKT